MNEARVYADGFERSFAEVKDLLEFLAERGRNAKWIRKPTNTLRLAPLEKEAQNLDAADASMEEILEDTEKNTQLVLKMRGESYPVRDCAIRTILSRAGVNGDGLRKLDKATYAKVVNYCLRVAKGDALIKIAALGQVQDVGGVGGHAADDVGQFHLARVIEAGEGESQGGLQPHHAAGGAGEGAGLLLGGVGGVVGGDDVDCAVLQSGDDALHVLGGAQGRIDPGHGTLGEDLVLGEPGHIFKGGAGDGHQGVDGDGVDAELCKADRHVQAVFPRFTHADDASAAEVHPYSSCGMQGFQLLFLCMRGTERVEVGRSRFEVTVVPGHSGIIQCLQLFFVQQSERSAQPDRRMATHPPGRYTELFHVFGRRFASTGHQ